MKKYKAWAKDFKKIAKVYNIDFEKRVVEISWESTGQSYTYNFENVELLECIGEKDKNGKEIYSNYILKTNEAGWIGKVVFKNAIFCLEDNLGGFSDYPDWDKCEIIGNIYENPELLNKRS